jgi:hypothetical protein
MAAFPIIAYRRISFDTTDMTCQGARSHEHTAGAEQVTHQLREKSRPVRLGRDLGKPG